MLFAVCCCLLFVGIIDFSIIMAHSHSLCILLLLFLLFLSLVSPLRHHTGATPVLTSILAFVAASSSNNGGGAASAATAAGSTTTAFLLLLFYSLGYATPLLLVAGTGGQALAKLKAKNDDGTNTSLYGRIGPWVTPLTGAILLWYGTTGLLTSVLGDPSLLGLPVFE